MEDSIGEIVIGNECLLAPFCLIELEILNKMLCIMRFYEEFYLEETFRIKFKQDLLLFFIHALIVNMLQNKHHAS